MRYLSKNLISYNKVQNAEMENISEHGILPMDLCQKGNQMIHFKKFCFLSYLKHFPPVCVCLCYEYSAFSQNPYLVHLQFKLDVFGYRIIFHKTVVLILHFKWVKRMFLLFLNVFFNFSHWYQYFNSLIKNGESCDWQYEESLLLVISTPR